MENVKQTSIVIWRLLCLKQYSETSDFITVILLGFNFNLVAVLMEVLITILMEIKD